MRVSRFYSDTFVRSVMLRDGAVAILIAAMFNASCDLSYFVLLAISLTSF